MLILTALFKKVLLAALILGVVLSASPIAGAQAKGPAEDGKPPSGERSNLRLEQAWARVQAAYQRQGDRLAKVDEVVGKVQTLISKANEKGWDTSAIQAALSAFQAAVSNASAIHANASGIIANHAGFDANGKVTDRAQAVETVKALRQALKDARDAMGGTGKALIEAIKAFIAAHRPAQSPAPATQ